MQKEEFYKGLKTIGFVSFIPFILASGALTGYFIGIFLQKIWHLPNYAVLISSALGFALGVKEMVKALKILARINKQ